MFRPDDSLLGIQVHQVHARFIFSIPAAAERVELSRAAHPPARRDAEQPDRRGRGDRAAGGGGEGAGGERARCRCAAGGDRSPRRRAQAGSGARRRLRHGARRRAALAAAPRHLQAAQQGRPLRHPQLWLSRRGAALDRGGLALRPAHRRGGRALRNADRGRRRERRLRRGRGSAARHHHRGARSVLECACAAEVHQTRGHRAGPRAGRGAAPGGAAPGRRLHASRGGAHLAAVGGGRDPRGARRGGARSRAARALHSLRRQRARRSRPWPRRVSRRHVWRSKVGVALRQRTGGARPAAGPRRAARLWRSAPARALPGGADFPRGAAPRSGRERASRQGRGAAG